MACLINRAMVLEIITPESKVFNGEIVAAQFPGKDGLFQVLDNHAPVISALVEGKIKVDLVKAIDKKFNMANGRIEKSSVGDKQILVHVKGGIVEMMNNKIIVLAE
jgi:F-type H+-transporting ATPase subunit epsilon